MLDYGYFAFLMLVGQLSPGPDMLLILKNSFNHGLRAALFTITGIIAGIVIHTTIALTGLAFLMRKGSATYLILKYGGALYLTFLGIKLLLSLRKKTTTDEPEQTGAAKARPVDLPVPGGPTPAAQKQICDSQAFAQGFLTNILNPKVVIIISSILMMFLDGDSNTGQRLTYGAILVIEGTIVWVLFALLLQTRHAKKQFLRWESPINAIFGALLIALAIRAIFK